MIRVFVFCVAIFICETVPRQLFADDVSSSSVQNVTSRVGSISVLGNANFCRQLVVRNSFPGGVVTYSVGVPEKIGSTVRVQNWSKPLYFPNFDNPTTHLQSVSFDFWNERSSVKVYLFDTGGTFTDEFLVVPPADISEKDVFETAKAAGNWDPAIQAARKKGWMVYHVEDTPYDPSESLNIRLVRVQNSSYLLYEPSRGGEPVAVLFDAKRTGHLRELCEYRDVLPATTAPRPRLSSKDVQKLADAAASMASYDMTQFMPFRMPNFDPVTRVWSIEYSGRVPTLGRPTKGNPLSRFRVFVYDATSHTEVTCLGLSGEGGWIPIDEVPTAVRPFVAGNESVMDLYCADLNGDGRPDYLLVTQDQEQTRRTLQILLSGPDDKLTSVVQNEHVVQPPFAGSFTIIARRNRFEVQNTSAGSGGGDTYLFYFEYSPREQTWLLTRVQKDLFGYAHSEDDNPYTRLPRDFGRVTIADFNLRAFDY